MQKMSENDSRLLDELATHYHGWQVRIDRPSGRFGESLKSVQGPIRVFKIIPIMVGTNHFQQIEIYLEWAAEPEQQKRMSLAETYYLSPTPLNNFSVDQLSYGAVKISFNDHELTFYPQQHPAEIADPDLALAS